MTQLRDLESYHREPVWLAIVKHRLLRPQERTVLSVLQCLPYADAAQGWRGSQTQLIEAYAVVTGHHLALANARRAVARLVELGLLSTARESRWTRYMLHLDRCPEAARDAARDAVDVITLAGRGRSELRSPSRDEGGQGCDRPRETRAIGDAGDDRPRETRVVPPSRDEGDQRPRRSTPSVDLSRPPLRPLSRGGRSIQSMSARARPSSEGAVGAPPPGASTSEAGSAEGPYVPLDGELVRPSEVMARLAAQRTPGVVPPMLRRLPLEREERSDRVELRRRAQIHLARLAAERPGADGDELRRLADAAAREELEV